MEAGYQERIAERRAQIRERVAEAERRSGRPAGGVRVMAVSKTVGVPEVVAALRGGYRLFGENRPQELARKLEGLASEPGLPDFRFDMIGNLQTNKINSVIGRAAVIHSVRSAELARAVSSRVERKNASGEHEGPQPVLLEVNVSGEASKSGFSPEGLRADLDEVCDLPGIEVCGLMTMAPAGDPSAARATFSGLRELRDRLAAQRPDAELGELSMGMSGDFEIAVEEGSTLVRLGRVVFDPEFGVK